MVASDGPALVRFHEALSTDAQRSRFFGLHSRLSASEVDRFSHVDHVDREAIIVKHGLRIARQTGRLFVADISVPPHVYAAIVVAAPAPPFGLGPIVQINLERPTSPTPRSDRRTI